MTYHRWTQEMELWLMVHYENIGDKELSELMNITFPHKQKWTLKHIEKKRSYLNLKRTKEQVFFIKSENNKSIDRSKMWDTRGRTPAGSVVVWKVGGYDVEFIRLEKAFERLSRYNWEKHHGKIKEGFNVVLKDHRKSAGDMNNLILLSNAELAAFNSKNRLPEELRETKTLLKKLQTTINEKQDFGFKQSPVRAA